MSDSINLFILLYMTAVGLPMNAVLAGSRYPPRRTALILCGAMIMLSAAVFFVYRAAGADVVLRIYTLLVHAPGFVLFFFIGRYRGWRLVFQMLTAILFCNLIHQAGGLAFYASGQRLWALLAAYFLSTAAVFWLLARCLYPLLQQAFVSLRRGWGLMCIIMAAYYVITIYLIPGHVGDSFRSTVFKPAVSFLMAGFFTALIVLFSALQREEEARHSAQLFSVQLAALEKRMDTVRAAEETIRMERHDLRHRLQAVAELVQRGKTQAVLDLIGAAETRLSEEKMVHWCRPPILDAVFSSYMEEARMRHIQIHASIALPEPLPVEEAELAIVLANALENAVHACMPLPQQRREIYCNVICYPRLMFEIRNPYTGVIRFDGKGQPLSDRQGHGLGTRSIADFCRKTGASCQYEAKDGWFSLRVIL